MNERDKMKLKWHVAMWFGREGNYYICDYDGKALKSDCDYDDAIERVNEHNDAIDSAIKALESK